MLKILYSQPSNTQLYSKETIHKAVVIFINNHNKTKIMAFDTYEKNTIRPETIRL